MEFRIAVTFTDSLARLTADEQKAVKTTAFDLQLNPSHPGLKFHRIEKVKDNRFWAVWVNTDIRLIVHRSDQSLLLCFAAHHDKAYEWASRRKLEVHPQTGAAQFVEIRETVKEIVVPVYIPAIQSVTPALPENPMFSGVSDPDLLAYGVPAEWLPDVRSVKSEDALLALIDHLPAEAGEALLELAIGVTPPVPQPVETAGNPFDHPDALRRFRIVENQKALRQALDYPWEKWTIFLHPDQMRLVEQTWNGPVRISGSAGTGKTIVALHRAVHLARINPGSRVLLVTFTFALANMLRVKLYRLAGNEPGLIERIDVYALDMLGMRLYHSRFGSVRFADSVSIRESLGVVQIGLGVSADLRFLWTEWDQVVDAWQLKTWEEYRDIDRLGRKKALPESSRKQLWSIFQRVREDLKQDNRITVSEMFHALAVVFSRSETGPFDFVVVDEAQDISIMQLRFLVALGKHRPDSLFFVGDLGQRIFQPLFSWRALGVDIRGRSRTLRINYRTSHQIRVHADRLLGAVFTDVDGHVEDRSGTISVFNGPAPMIRSFPNEEDEKQFVSRWIAERISRGFLPHEIGIFIRSIEGILRPLGAVRGAGLNYRILQDDRVESKSGSVSITTMHLAKGLEFRAVVVMACDDTMIPLQERIETVGEESDLREVINTERQLLYVACTRAREELLITGVDPVSEFLDDISRNRSVSP